MALDRALSALRQLDATADRAREYRRTVKIVFKGLLDAPRKLYQIPAVRAFMRALTAQWPFWPHLCSKTSDSLVVILLPLLDNMEAARGDSTVEFRVNPEQLN